MNTEDKANLSINAEEIAENQKRLAQFYTENKKLQITLILAVCGVAGEREIHQRQLPDEALELIQALDVDAALAGSALIGAMQELGQFSELDLELT